MTNLTAAAQAVLDAAINVAESPDAEAIAAAVLRAAATQVTPVSTNARQMTIRAKLLNIADELEDVKYGTYRCNLEDKPQ